MVLFLGDDLALLQVGEPLQLVLGISQLSLRPLDVRIRALQLGGEPAGVNLVKLLASLDVGTFNEQPLQNHAANLWPHLGDAVGRGATGQLGRQRHVLRFQRQGRDFPRRGGSAFLRLPTTADERRQARDSGESQAKAHGARQPPER